MKIFIECFYSTVEVTQFNKHSMYCSIYYHLPGVFMAHSLGHKMTVRAEGQMVSPSVID